MVVDLGQNIAANLPLTEVGDERVFAHEGLVGGHLDLHRERLANSVESEGRPPRMPGIHANLGGHLFRAVVLREERHPH